MEMNESRPLPHYSQMTSQEGLAIERAYARRRAEVEEKVKSFRLDFPEFQEFMIDHGLDRDFLEALQEWVNDTADSPAPHPKLYRVIMEKMQRRAEALTPDVDDEAIQEGDR